MAACKYTEENVDAAITYAMGVVGVEELKAEQSEATKSFVNVKDIFVAFPTGYWISYCTLRLAAISF